MAVAVPQEMGLSVSRDPKAVLAEAHRAASALKEALDAKPKEKWVMMNGERYLEYEDWATVGKFYGITAKVVSTTPVEFGSVRGFEARAAAFHIPTGQEISAADAMCLNDEERWSSRPKYEYRDGQRVKVGETPVPLFQLRSMAQTRACAKVLRNVLSWVVVLAGFKPTPAEEMTGAEGSREPVRKPEAKESAEVQHVIGTVESIDSKDVKKKDGSGTFEALTVRLSGGFVGQIAGFLPAAKVIRQAKEDGSEVRVGYTASKFGNKIGSADLVSDAQEA